MVEFAGMTEQRYEQLLEGTELDRRAAVNEIWADLKRVRGVLNAIRVAHYLPLDWMIREGSGELNDEEYERQVFLFRERGIACKGSR